MCSIIKLFTVVIYPDMIDIAISIDHVFQQFMVPLVIEIDPYSY